MRGILEKTFKGWVVNTDTVCYQLHEADAVWLDEEDAGFFGVHSEVDIELVMGYDSVFKITRPFAKLATPMLDRLKTHLESITPEQFGEEMDEVAEWFQSEISDDDGLTDDELIIKDLYREKQQHAIDFAKWLAQDWMAIWVVDKWMWENVDGLASKNYKHNGMYYTEEELYELYLKSE